MLVVQQPEILLVPILAEHLTAVRHSSFTACERAWPRTAHDHVIVRQATRPRVARSRLEWTALSGAPVDRLGDRARRTGGTL